MRAHVIRIVLVLAVCGVSSQAAKADNFAYAAATDGNLYLVDLTTSTPTLIGSMDQPQFMEGLALSPGGQLFGTDDAGNLFSINPTTGAATLIGSTGLGDVEGLKFDGVTLLGINFAATPTVFSINTVTAGATDVVTADSPTGAVRAMTVLDPNDVLVRGDGPPNNTLYSLNLSTGFVTTIGTLAVDGSQFAAMDFVNGVLYGLDNDGSEWIINPSDAAVTLVGNTGRQFWLEMTAVTSTPEPATLPPFGLGLLCLGSRLLKRVPGRTIELTTGT